MRSPPAWAAVVALSSAATGCYLSHERPICVYDVPEEERCLEPPGGVDRAQLAWTGGSFIHRDPREGCIAVSVDPAMVRHREILEDAIALIAAAECGGACFGPTEVLATDALGLEPRVHLAPDGTCEGGPLITSCMPDLDICRGTIAVQILALAEGAVLGPWTTEALAANVALGFGIQSVSYGETRDGDLSARVESLLCAIHAPDDPWCPGG